MIELEQIRGRGMIVHIDGTPIRVVDYFVRVIHDLSQGHPGRYRTVGDIGLERSRESNELIGLPLILQLADGRVWEFTLIDEADAVSRGLGLYMPATAAGRIDPRRRFGKAL